MFEMLYDEQVQLVTKLNEKKSDYRKRAGSVEEHLAD